MVHGMQTVAKYTTSTCLNCSSFFLDSDTYFFHDASFTFAESRVSSEFVLNKFHFDLDPSFGFLAGLEAHAGLDHHAGIFTFWITIIQSCFTSWPFQRFHLQIQSIISLSIAIMQAYTFVHKLYDRQSLSLTWMLHVFVGKLALKMRVLRSAAATNKTHSLNWPASSLSKRKYRITHSLHTRFNDLHFISLVLQKKYLYFPHPHKYHWMYVIQSQFWLSTCT